MFTSANSKRDNGTKRDIVPNVMAKTGQTGTHPFRGVPMSRCQTFTFSGFEFVPLRSLVGLHPQTSRTQKEEEVIPNRHPFLVVLWDGD